MKAVRNTFLLTLSLFLCMGVVKAESYYTNNNGVSLTEKEYNYVIDFYGDDYPSQMTEEDYNWIQKMDVNNREYKIEKYYGNKSSLTKAIDNLSFDVEKGEFVAIMGASGSGKTTLLNCISTIDKVTSGHIYVAGNDITKLRGNSLNKFRREELGFIFQDFNLLDTLTAYENIALALSIQNVNSREIDTRIKKVAKELDIVNVLNKYPYQMSGGQKQRVASARAIITNPKLILADEPTGALDSKSAKMLLEKFDYLNKELQATILMVTHDAFTASYSSRVIFIKDGKIFNEIIKGTNSRKEFFDKIIDVVTLLGGDLNDAL